MVGGEEPYGAIRDAVLVIREGRIAWLGDAAGAPSELVGNPEQTLDAEGGWATPGLIDCHTHLVFGGDRAREFEMRLRGASYEEIARAGGGRLPEARLRTSSSRPRAGDLRPCSSTASPQSRSSRGTASTSRASCECYAWHDVSQTSIR